MMQESATDAGQRLLSLLAGKWVTAAIAAAAELGLADALDKGAMALAELAVVLGCDPSALGRLLGVLVSEGLLELDAAGGFTLTALGAELKQDSLRDLARFVGAPFMWTPWAHLADAVRGRVPSAFEASQGAALFPYLDEHVADAELYHRAVDAFTRREARALAEAFDFSELGHIVDVGGGLGTLLVEVLSRYPALEGTLFDRPSVIVQAKTALAGAPERSRMGLCGGDFFEALPPDADAYVLKHVLHNWSDAQAECLLRHCVAGLRPGGKVLIVEGLLLPGNIRDATRLFDLEMFVLCGAGRERTKPEFRGLLGRSGLRLVTAQSLAGTTRLLVAEPRAQKA
jgi:precorrin-6B methylase 2